MKYTFRAAWDNYKFTVTLILICVGVILSGIFTLFSNQDALSALLKSYPERD